MTPVSSNTPATNPVARSTVPDSFTGSLINVTEQDIHLHKGLVAVIPAYNEQIALGSVVLLVRQYVDQVIVVDDGSTDRTFEVAKKAGAEVIHLDENMGKAYALLLGLKRAGELNCTAAVMLDADGQHYTRDIPRLTALVLSGDADLVIGSRFIENKGKIPLYRQAGQKTLNIFTNFGSKADVSDSQSGYRALSRKALDNLDFKSDGYNVESDMIAHFVAKGLVIKEVPINVRMKLRINIREPGDAWDGGAVPLVTLISYKRPLLAFGIPGSLMIVAGMIAEIWVLEELRNGHIFHDVLAIASAFVLVLGMLLMIAGLILNTLVIIMSENRGMN